MRKLFAYVVIEIRLHEDKDEVITDKSTKAAANIKKRICCQIVLCSNIYGKYSICRDSSVTL